MYSFDQVGLLQGELSFANDFACPQFFLRGVSLEKNTELLQDSIRIPVFFVVTLKLGK